MADVALTLLGSPAIRFTDGRPLAPLSAKALALVAYLAVTRREQSREDLATLLWGDSPEAEARGSLRQALKQLRDRIGDAVIAGRSAVSLAPTVQSDVEEFRLAVRHDPSYAATFDAPGFLRGLTVRHARPFEEWVAEVRSGLVRDYTGVLTALAQDAMRGWRWRDVLELAGRWSSCEPLSEEAARLAVEALFLSGDRGSALARFEAYRATLRRETGCEPGRALRELVGRIERSGEVAVARPVSDEWYVRAPSFEASLVGRSAELASLGHAWKTARRGRQQVVLIEGEAGVGKSRLVEESLRKAVTDGGVVLRGRGLDLRAGLPYAGAVDVLRDAMDAPGLSGTSPEWLTEVARLVPELRQRFPGLPEPAPPSDAAEAADAWRLFEAVAQVLLSLTAESPVVISLDDLQWCDGDTCNLVRYLLRRLAQAPVLWLCTITLGELEREAPAARLSRALRAQADTLVVTLAPLTEEEVWELVRELGHVSTPTGARRFAARIHGITAGNPFYVIELLKTMFAQGLVSADPDTGEWSVEGGAEARAELPVSQTVQGVIAERVERLPDPLRDVLITIAVAGTGCRTTVLSHVHGISRLRAATLGDALVERWLVIEEARVYRCAHRLIARVVRDSLTASRRREEHRMIALALDRVTPPNEATAVAAELARHADRGGEPELACRFALVSATEAMRRFAFEEALSWLDLAAGNAQTPTETDTVNRLTADVLEVAGWSEAPPFANAGRLQTREIERDDLDLAIRP